MNNEQQAGPKQNGQNTQNGQTEILRINRAFQLSVFGLLLAAALVFFLLDRPATDITSIVGLFTTVLGTLVGTFFGVQAGSANKEKAEERADAAQKRADAAQKKVDALHAASDEETIIRAVNYYPDLFKK